MKRFSFIALHAHRLPVRQQCQLLGVSPNGYYDGRRRAPSLADPQAIAAANKLAT